MQHVSYDAHVIALAERRVIDKGGTGCPRRRDLVRITSPDTQVASEHCCGGCPASAAGDCKC